MAAATQVPGGPWINKGFDQELIENMNKAIAAGIFAGTDTVTAALANLATDKALR
jgi:hypothetical protein